VWEIGRICEAKRFPSSTIVGGSKGFMNRLSLGAALALYFCALLFCARAGATTSIDLDRDWFFRIDPGQIGATTGWQKSLPADTESVNLPHTWNIGRHDNYLGKAWYFRSFEMPLRDPDLHASLHFGATFYSARIWLNGTEVGRHEGGYTAYSFDITRYLHATNYLAVEIDNRIGEATIPGFALRGHDSKQTWYDWWDYGGIVRDVSLTLAGPVEIERQRIRSNVSAQAQSATIEDKIFLKSRLSKSAHLRVRATAFGPDNQPASTETETAAIEPGAREVMVSLALLAPKLWSVDHPNVYRMVVQIAGEDGKVLDKHSDTFGIRTVEIRDRHLLINGERVRLTGVTRHEESVAEGLAETPGTMLYDYDDMKALQVTLTRPVHYPQNPFILDYADRHGILLIPEIPVWQFSEAQMRDPKVLALAEQQMREMIEQAGNHPSIFAWSVCNESDTETPGGIAYFRAVRDFIRQLDPDRYVSYADDNLAKVQNAQDSAANDADFVMMNEYFGSWHGPAAALPASLDKVDRLFPNKMVIISEFGLPGIFGKDAEDADRMRVKIIEDQIPELARRDWIAGAIFWCYQDYKSRRNLRPGLEEGYVDHGLVDEYRQRRPSYYVWKEMNSPAAIAGRWEQPTKDAPTAFTATVQANARERLPSYPLHDYRLEWDVRDENNKIVASGAQALSDLVSAQTIEGKVQPLAQTAGLRLHLVLLSPTGSVAGENSVDWHSSVIGPKAEPAALPVAPLGGTSAPAR
jgi:beta-glucuronidase